MNISGKSNEHRFMKARHDRVPVLHHDSNFKFTPKVFSITPNRNLITPKVTVSQRKIVDWERTYFLSKYYGF